MLEHLQTTTEQTPGLPGGGSVKLSEAELSELLDNAMARHNAAATAQELPVEVLTVEDALEIARTMGIPEEHVRDAAEAMVRKKRLGQVRLTDDEKERRQVFIRQKRRLSFVRTLSWFGPAAVLSLAAGLLVPFKIAAILMITFLIPVLVSLFRMLAPVADTETASAELGVDAGTCRVCGAPAHTPRSTFCEQHRYKGPTGEA